VAVVLTQVLPGLATWRFADSAERWRLAAAALRVLRLALLAPPAPAAGTSGAPCPRPGSALPRPTLAETACVQPFMEKGWQLPCQSALSPGRAARAASALAHEQTLRRAGGARYAPESGDLAAAVAAALRQEGAAAAALLPALPPPAAALEALAGRDGGGDAAAAEALAAEWFVLLPALAARASGPAVAAALLQVRGPRRGCEQKRTKCVQRCRLWRQDSLPLWTRL